MAARLCERGAGGGAGWSCASLWESAASGGVSGNSRETAMAWRAHAPEVHGPLTCLLAKLRCRSALQRLVCDGNSRWAARVCQSSRNQSGPSCATAFRASLRAQEGWGSAAVRRHSAAAANAFCLVVLQAALIPEALRPRTHGAARQWHREMSRWRAHLMQAVHTTLPTEPCRMHATLATPDVEVDQFDCPALAVRQRLDLTAGRSMGR